MPRYKLTYFDGRGRAEAMRLLLHDAAVDFEDIRLTNEEWAPLKDSGAYPLKQIPILEVDGKVLVQSRAIMRHLSRKYGYNGKSEEEATKIDVISEVLEELTAPVWNTIFSDFDENYKKGLKESWPKTTGPLRLKFLEKILGENPDGNGYFVGKDVTMADFIFYSFIESVVNVFPDALDDYPKLRANREVVKSREKVAAYLATQTPYHM